MLIILLVFYIVIGVGFGLLYFSDSYDEKAKDNFQTILCAIFVGVVWIICLVLILLFHKNKEDEDYEAYFNRE